jgi:hypothetical protein
MSKAHSATPAWFALQGVSQWSMLRSTTYTGPASLGGLFTETPFNRGTERWRTIIKGATKSRHSSSDIRAL